MCGKIRISLAELL